MSISFPTNAKDFADLANKASYFEKKSRRETALRLTDSQWIILGKILAIQKDIPDLGFPAAVQHYLSGELSTNRTLVNGTIQQIHSQIQLLRKTKVAARKTIKAVTQGTSERPIASPTSPQLTTSRPYRDEINLPLLAPQSRFSQTSRPRLPILSGELLSEMLMKTRDEEKNDTQPDSPDSDDDLPPPPPLNPPGGPLCPASCSSPYDKLPRASMTAQVTSSGSD